jgi:hypothetical protein
VRVKLVEAPAPAGAAGVAVVVQQQIWTHLWKSYTRMILNLMIQMVKARIVFPP